MANGHHKAAGFSMIEILVTLVLVAVGLLGLAGLQSRAQQAELESYQRTQALVLLQDMATRISTNQGAAGCYNTTALTPSYLGNGNTATPSCNAYGTTATQAVAVSDMTEWDALLKGQAESMGGSKVGAMIGARGCIVPDAANDTFVVTVVWQGLTDTVAPSDTCGQGLYGTNDAKRRAVSTTVRIANLS